VRSLDVPPVAGAVRLALGLLPGRPLGGLGAESTL
jgi:hypothetical protein